MELKILIARVWLSSMKESALGKGLRNLKSVFSDDFANIAISSLPLTSK